ncbi:MAG: hypothetical protein HZC28_09305 [Spirochaetes bacterium]|nr:hypothetical protein [Spirochaetota bacterium]
MHIAYKTLVFTAIAGFALSITSCQTPRAAILPSAEAPVVQFSFVIRDAADMAPIGRARITTECYGEPYRGAQGTWGTMTSRSYSDSNGMALVTIKKAGLERVYFLVAAQGYYTNITEEYPIGSNAAVTVMLTRIPR